MLSCLIFLWPFCPFEGELKLSQKHVIHDSNLEVIFCLPKPDIMPLPRKNYINKTILHKMEA